MNTEIHSVFSVSTADRVPMFKEKFVVTSQTSTPHSHQIDIHVPIDPFPLNSSPNYSLVPQFFVIHAYIRVLAFRDIPLQELMNYGFGWVLERNDRMGIYSIHYNAISV